MRTFIMPSTLNGSYTPHTSKSMMHRALICSAFSENPTTILNPLIANDIMQTINALTEVGASFQISDDRIMVTPIKTWLPITKPIECIDSATTLRMLAPILAYLNQGISFQVNDALLRRIKKEDFAFLGLDYKVDGQIIIFTPLEIKPKYQLNTIHTTQTSSGLLLLSPLLREEIEITVDQKELDPYLALTLEVMDLFGNRPVINYHEKITITTSRTKYQTPGEVVLRKDYSNAAGFILFGALNNGITINDTITKPLLGDEKVLEIVQKMGSKVSYEDDKILISKSTLQPIAYDFGYHPDLAPIVIATSTLLNGVSKFTGLNRLIDKESNRLANTVSLLSSLGANITFKDECITVVGPTKYEGGQELDCYNDHRMAFMLAFIGSNCEKGLKIKGSEAINKSYPAFLNDFALLGGKYHNE